MKKTVAIYTLGCRANQFDSESIISSFFEQGYQKVQEFSNADVHIVNTCTVTNASDKKSQQIIKRLVKKFSNSQIVATGCSAQQNPETLSKLGVNLVVDNTNKNQIFEYLETSKTKPIVNTPIRKLKIMEQKMIYHFGEKTRANLKIQDGCNQYCSYCIIPHVRGRSRSLDPVQIREQLSQLIQQGYKEIVLTGIHVGHYHYNDLDFANILEIILNTDSNFRVRLSSIEPLEINDRVLHLFRRFPKKLCRFLHIAIQSGSSSILNRMKRQYDATYLTKLFNNLHQIDPNFGLGIDVIVGFPNESELEFLETVNFVKTLPLYYGHVFPFSAKNGTPAATLPNQISTIEKKTRCTKLRLVIQQQQEKFLKQLIDQKRVALFEKNSIGVLDNFVRIKVDVKVQQHKQALVELKSSWSQSETEKYPIIHCSLIELLN